MAIYHLEMLGTAVFAATGVLAVRRPGVDVFGGLVLGLVTALGGGTVRDVVLDAPIFWIRDFNYVWAALAAALVAFFFTRLFSVGRLLQYLDGFGAALFAVSAVDKVTALGFGAPVAVIMGVQTAIGGGLLRDVLAGRPTLLMTREIYATPILLGCALYAAFHRSLPYSHALAVLFISGLRSIAIRRNLQMPAWLTGRDSG